jgi:hypothetical protein
MAMLVINFNEEIMKKLFLAIAAVIYLSGCSGIKLVSDYDEVIDRGITEFAEKFNTHIKNMGDLAGTPDGTFEENLRTYNALESKLDVMIARASSASEGKGCKLEKKVFDRVKSLLKNDMPAEMKTTDSVQGGNSNGCNERLLVLVKDQLSSVKKIHREIDKCGEKNITCLRPATSKTALSIANQSINAVSIVENAKKQ